MKKSFFVSLLLTILSITNVFASVSDEQALQIAKAGIESYNAAALINGYSEQRLFDARFKLTSENCFEKEAIIGCDIDTTEKQTLDKDVYTPNVLHINLNPKSGTLIFDLEIGC